MSVIIRRYTDLMKFYWFFYILLFLLCIVVYVAVCFVCFCLIWYIMYCFCYVYVFFLLCMFCSVYFVSFCCSVYCLCANVYCTTATGCQPNCCYHIYHIIPYHISYHIISCHISYHTIPYHITSYHIVSYISYHTSYHITSHHVMSCLIIYHIISYICFRVKMSPAIPAPLTHSCYKAASDNSNMCSHTRDKRLAILSPSLCGMFMSTIHYFLPDRSCVDCRKTRRIFCDIQDVRRKVCQRQNVIYRAFLNSYTKNLLT